MVTSWPKGMAGLGSGAERLADRIGNMSGGRLTVKVLSAGELVPATQCLDAVSQGVADMAHDFASYHTHKAAAAGFFASVPLGLAPDEFDGWMTFGGGQELWDELYGHFGVKPFLAGNTGIQMGGWLRKELKTVKDLTGLRFATAGYAANVMDKLGAKPVNLPIGEIFGNLQSGNLDGAEWIGPYSDLSMGLYKVTKLYYWPGLLQPRMRHRMPGQQAQIRRLGRRPEADRGRGLRGGTRGQPGGIFRAEPGGARHPGQRIQSPAEAVPQADRDRFHQSRRPGDAGTLRQGG